MAYAFYTTSFQRIDLQENTPVILLGLSRCRKINYLFNCLFIYLFLLFPELATVGVTEVELAPVVADGVGVGADAVGCNVTENNKRPLGKLS